MTARKTTTKKPAKTKKPVANKRPAAKPKTININVEGAEKCNCSQDGGRVIRFYEAYRRLFPNGAPRLLASGRDQALIEDFAKRAAAARDEADAEAADKAKAEREAAAKAVALRIERFATEELRRFKARLPSQEDELRADALKLAESREATSQWYVRNERIKAGGLGAVGRFFYDNF
jgi:hypothetical protein